MNEGGMSTTIKICHLGNTASARGSRANLNKLHSQERHIQISSEIIIPTSVVRDLGVQLDSELSMKQHVYT